MRISQLGLLSAIAGLFLAGCAVSPEYAEQQRVLQNEIDAILADPFEGEGTDLQQRCLSDRQYDSFRALDERHILFEGRRDKLWVNTLRGRCPDLRHGTVLRVRSTSLAGRLCDMDSFAVDDWFTWPWYRRWPWQWGGTWSTGMTCTLGKFRPANAAQIELIEQLIKSR